MIDVKEDDQIILHSCLVASSKGRGQLDPNDYLVQLFSIVRRFNRKMGHQTQLIETNHEVGAVKHADFSNFDKDSTTWFLLVPFSIILSLFHCLR